MTSAGYEFWPLATESHGLHGKSSRVFVNKLGTIAASRGDISKSAFVRSVYKALSIALVRGQSIMYDASLERVVRAAGQSFEQGSRVVLQECCADV